MQKGEGEERGENKPEREKGREGPYFLSLIPLPFSLPLILSLVPTPFDACYANLVPRVLSYPASVGKRVAATQA